MARRIAPAIAAADGAHLAAVASRDPAKAAAFALEWEAPRAWTSYAELAARVDAVYIATPNALHAEQTLLCLEPGKHVLVEKPMALAVEDAARMVATARRLGLQLGAGFHLRHHPVHLELRRLLDAGEAGELTYAHAVWGGYVVDFPRDSWSLDPEVAGAGSLMGRGVHVIDLLCWLVGRNVLEVTAFADGPNERNTVEWLTAATLRFEGETYAQFASSRRLANPDDSLVLYGVESRLEARSTLSMNPEGELRVVRDGATTVTRPTLRDLYTLEVEAFSRALENGTEFHASGEDGLRSVIVTTAILEAARTGCAQPVACEGASADL